MRALRAIALVIPLVLIASSANASYNGEINYDNPRIVPLFDQPNSETPTYSGFLYSSRIVFSAGHSNIGFDEAGNKIQLQQFPTYVGLPNSKASSSLKRVRVIKRFVAPEMYFNNGTLRDFAIYVLESDLVDIAPAKLMTPEIEKELTDARASVNIHGYGEYLDSCAPNEVAPCKGPLIKSMEPRQSTFQLHPYEDFQSLVGYNRPQLKDHLLMFGAGKRTACGGDSGGSITTTYKGELLYLSVTPNGMNGYACGRSGDFDGKGGIMYASQIYAHLNIVKEAKDFVDQQIAAEKALAKASADAKANAASKTLVISCKKGATVKKVKALKPKCPKGYVKVATKN